MVDKVERSMLLKVVLQLVFHPHGLLKRFHPSSSTIDEEQLRLHHCNFVCSTNQGVATSWARLNTITPVPSPGGW